MQCSANLRFVKYEENDFNDRVDNMTSSFHNIELQTRSETVAR